MKSSPCLFIFFLLFMCACASEKEEREDGIVYIYLDSLIQRTFWVDYMDKCRFIKLETTAACLIRSVKKLEFDDNKIFVKDHVDRLFVFDNEGRFLNTIGEIGMGPDEQLSMYDFYLDKKRQRVYILDIYKSTLFQYDYTGKLVEQKKVDGKWFANTSRITLLDDDYLLLVQDNQHNSLYNYRLLDLKSNQWKDCLPYPVTGEMTMAFGESTFGKSGEDTYVRAFLSDTICRYDRDTENMLPRYVFKGKFKPAKKEDFEGVDYELGLEAIRTLRSKKLSFGIGTLYATGTYLYFEVTDPDGRTKVLFDMESQTGFYHPSEREDVWLFPYHLITATEDAFVGVVYPGDVMDEEVSLPPLLKEIVDNSREDDNPVLLFFIP